MPRRLFRKVVTVIVEEIVALIAEVTIHGLGATPILELLFRARRMAQRLDFDGVDSTGSAKFVGTAPFDSLSIEPFLAVDEDGCVRYHIYGVFLSEELTGERPRHAHGEVIDGQVYFICGRRRRAHAGCWLTIRGLRALLFYG